MHKRTILNSALAVSIFLLPSNWFVVVTSYGSYVHGLQVDYLLPKLYASLLAAFVFSGLWMWWHTNDLRSNITRYPLAWGIGGGGVLLIALHQLITRSQLSSWWFLAQLVIVGFFALALYHQKKLLLTALSIRTLYATIGFQFLLGSYQFFAQKSLGGYWLLGEPQLTAPFGLATHSFGGRELVLAYGTTPHPNVFAGVVIGLFLLVLLITKQKIRLSNPIFLTYLGLGLITVYISQSLSGLLLLLAGSGFLGMYEVKKRWLSTRNITIALSVVLIALPLLLTAMPNSAENTSIDRRVALNTIAVRMLAQNPMWGAGLNSFTRNVEEFGGSETVRFVQPAHHTLLLIMTELGALGMVLFFVLFSILPYAVRRNMLLGALLLSGPLALDHYLYTVPQGLLLTALLLSSCALFQQKNTTELE